MLQNRKVNKRKGDKNQTEKGIKFCLTTLNSTQHSLYVVAGDDRNKRSKQENQIENLRNKNNFIPI